MKNIIYNFVCKGYIVNYSNLLETDPSLKDKELLEYAIVYGRYNILFHMLKDQYYIDILKDEDYNPLDFSCEIDLSRDMHDKSFWSNDEPEREIVNKRNIKHKECFELLESFNKRFTKNIFEKWYSLSINFTYYTGSYFPSVEILLKQFYEGRTPEMKEFIEDFEGLISNKKIIKIIFRIYNPVDILNKLKIE
jgi:hypothetical protein